MAPAAILGDDARLVLAARLTDAIDVVGATATAMRIAQHRRLHPNGAVTFFLPRTEPSPAATSSFSSRLLTTLTSMAIASLRPPTTPWCPPPRSPIANPPG